MNLSKADMKAIAQALFAAGQSGGRAVSMARQQEISAWFADVAESMPDQQLLVILVACFDAEGESA